MGSCLTLNIILPVLLGISDMMVIGINRLPRFPSLEGCIVTEVLRTHPSIGTLDVDTDDFANCISKIIPPTTSTSFLTKSNLTVLYTQRRQKFPAPVGIYQKTNCGWHKTGLSSLEVAGYSVCATNSSMLIMLTSPMALHLNVDCGPYR